MLNDDRSRSWKCFQLTCKLENALHPLEPFTNVKHRFTLYIQLLHKKCPKNTAQEILTICSTSANMRISKFGKFTNRKVGETVKKKAIRSFDWLLLGAAATSCTALNHFQWSFYRSAIILVLTIIQCLASAKGQNWLCPVTASSPFSTLVRFTTWHRCIAAKLT